MKTLEDFENEVIARLNRNAPLSAYAENIEMLKRDIELMRYQFCQENKKYVEDGPVIADCVGDTLDLSALVISREEWEMRKQREVAGMQLIKEAAARQSQQDEDELETLRAENAEMLEMLRWVVATDFGRNWYMSDEPKAQKERKAQKVREFVEKKVEEGK